MTRDEYLQHAEECERLAKTAQPSIRHALLSAAEMWRKMADGKRGDGAAPTLDSNPPSPLVRVSVRRVARLWWRKLVGDVLQILTKRSKSIRTDVAPQDDPAIRSHGYN